MHRLFVGDLPLNSSAQSVQEAFNKLRIEVISIKLRKGGFAFVDVPNQNAADRAIEMFKSIDAFGWPIRVEPSLPSRHNSARSYKIVVRQLPKDVDWGDFEQLLEKYGEVVQCDQAGNSESPSAIVTFKTSESAHAAVEKLNNSTYNTSTLRVTLAVDRSNKYGGGGGRRVTRIPHDDGGYGGQPHRSMSAEMPLRMVVNAKYVGAIIGQGGANIRQITKESKARCVVDVSRGLRDNAGNVEKVINIYGTPENASKACVKILEIVQRESQNDQANQGQQLEPELKLRAHNNLVGRLIGKGGTTIKKIMDDTGCTIFVSNHPEASPLLSSNPTYHPLQITSGKVANPGIIIEVKFCIGELSAFNMERTITIKGGTLDKISQAEQKISFKLRQCFENDITNAPHTMYGGVHPLMSTGMPQFAGLNVSGGDPSSPYSGAYSSPVSVLPPGANVSPYGGPLPPASSQAALMSSGGAAGPPPLPLMSSGSPMGMVSQQQNVGLTEVVHIWVPNNVVGALIGTRGSHIRQVMRLTGAHIRIETGPLPSYKQRGNDADDVNGGGADMEDVAAAGGDTASRNEGVRRRDAESSAPPQLQHQLVNDASERRVTITGTDQQQYKAQFWIFQRICEQGYNFFDDVRLCTEIQVPSKMVGRIIGKGGQNVRELQRVTGAQVKIPDDVAHDSPEDTVVRIIGNFNAVQAVQARIRQLMHLMQGRVGVH